MDKVLQKYLKSVKENASTYKNGELKTKEYIRSMQEIDVWLKERCDENPRN